MFADLTDLQKRALFKLSMDLVKIDHRIHHNEVLFIGDLQDKCKLSDEEIELSRYMSLQQAIEILKPLDDISKYSICSFLYTLISVDNDSDFREKILLSAIRMNLCAESESWSNIISVRAEDVEYTSNQIIYLEKIEHVDNHKLLSDDYTWLLLQKSFEDIGLQLFYLPKVISDLKVYLKDKEYNTKEELKRSLEIFFNKKHITFDEIDDALNSLSVSEFYKVILSNYGISPHLCPKSFLLLRIQDEYVLNDDNNIVKYENFLSIDVSQSIIERILFFVRLFDKPSSGISYEGYYKFLFDYVCMGTKISSSILLDNVYNFYLKDLDRAYLKFESSPQARTFYLLLLKYGPVGVSQFVFEEALAYLNDLDVKTFYSDNSFDVELFKKELLNETNECSLLIYNLVCIYAMISTKDVFSDNFLTYIANIIKYRSSLKNYINNTFNALSKLNNVSQYCIQFNKDSKCYYVALDISYFSVVENDCEVGLSESILWKNLK